ncbi:hypothetical protein [Streptomyces cellulosae]|uniref:Uncharacterized protein n=1 Tax=Streptomyces cellulosae TaxID=1968 RepID=A0ABW7YCI7_STRCE
MRNRHLSKSQSNPAPDVVRRRRDKWRQAQGRVVRFPQPNPHRAISRRGDR